MDPHLRFVTGRRPPSEETSGRSGEESDPKGEDEWREKKVVFSYTSDSCTHRCNSSSPFTRRRSIQGTGGLATYGRHRPGPVRGTGVRRPGVIRDLQFASL